jgi:hypothetical protein
MFEILNQVVFRMWEAQKGLFRRIERLLEEDQL